MDGSIRLMTDWLYRQAGQLIVPDPELWLTIMNSELWDSLKAFDANINQARSFWRRHPELIEHAVVNVHNLAVVTWQLTGVPELPESELNSPIAEAIKERLVAQFNKRLDETGDQNLAAGYDFERALDRFEGFIRTDPDFEREVFGIFLAQLVMAWTAFETLAGDLWRAIIFCDPQAIANPDRHSFQKLEGLRSAYAALMPPSQKINAILNEAGLKKLNLVRNLALHKAGMVDQWFLDDAQKEFWDVPDEKDYPIKLDGARVKNLINPVIQCGLDLIRAVDEWITIERQTRTSSVGQ